MKNNISYFSHDCDAHNHPKFKLLVAKYGLIAEARFWRLNSLIGHSENCYLDLSKARIKADVALVLNMTFAELDEFVEFLASDECELVKFSGSKLTTERCQETLFELSKVRSKDRVRKGQNSSTPETSDLHTENNAFQTESTRKDTISAMENTPFRGESKGKESKESKLNENFQINNLEESLRGTLSTNGSTWKGTSNGRSKE